MHVRFINYLLFSHIFYNSEEALDEQKDQEYVKAQKLGKL
jgi:hypothetical protein